MHHDRGQQWLWPADVLGDEPSESTRLYIEGLPPRDVADYSALIPASVLVSLAMAPPTPPLTAVLGLSLTRLLLAARRLETFRHQDRGGRGTHLVFSPGDGRLPALTRLVLAHYHWDHSRDDVAAHFDLSRLHKLDLAAVPLAAFLASVDFADLAGLEELRADDVGVQVPDRRDEATRGLWVLVKHHVRQLPSLPPCFSSLSCLMPPYLAPFLPYRCWQLLVADGRAARRYTHSARCA